MAITLGVGNNQASGSSNVGTVTLNGCTAGRQLVVVINWAAPNTATISSITCSGESAPTLIGSPLLQSTDIDSASQIAYLSNITSSGNKTITVNFSGIILFHVWVGEYQGGDTSAFYDAEVGATGTASTPATASLTTSFNNDLIVATVVANQNSSGWTPGTGYTGLSFPTYWWYAGGLEDVDVGSAGSKTVDMALGASGTWAIKAAAFKAAGAGGGGTNEAYLTMPPMAPGRFR